MVVHNGEKAVLDTRLALKLNPVLNCSEVVAQVYKA
jgi:hypothetical protein